MALLELLHEVATFLLTGNPLLSSLRSLTQTLNTSSLTSRTIMTLVSEESSTSGRLRGHFQTIIGKFNIIMTLGGEGVRVVTFTLYTSLNAWFLSRFLMLLSFSCDIKGREGDLKLMSQWRYFSKNSLEMPPNTNPPFTWPVIISALEKPSVAEYSLARDLRAVHLPTMMV